jgi:hypothetical protein
MQDENNQSDNIIKFVEEIAKTGIMSIIEQTKILERDYSIIIKSHDLAELKYRDRKRRFYS